MIKYEIKKIVKRKQFRIVFMLLFLAVIVDFIVTCKCYYGQKMTLVRSAYQCTILHNQIGLFTVQFFSVLLPVVSCLLASDLYYEENTLGITNYIYTRQKKKNDVGVKMVAVFCVVFFTFFSLLILNFLLTLCAFPVQSSYATNTTYLTLVGIEENRIFAWMEMYHPYLNMVIYIFIRSIMATFFAVFSFSVSLIYSGNRYIILLSAMLYTLLYENMLGLIPNEMVNTDIMGINNYGNGWMIVVFLGITLLFSIIMAWIGSGKDTVS